VSVRSDKDVAMMMDEWLDLDEPYAFKLRMFVEHYPQGGSEASPSGAPPFVPPSFARSSRHGVLAAELSFLGILVSPSELFASPSEITSNYTMVVGAYSDAKVSVLTLAKFWHGATETGP
jgi:hypothetical protein